MKTVKEETTLKQKYRYGSKNTYEKTWTYEVHLVISYKTDQIPEIIKNVCS